MLAAVIPHRQPRKLFRGSSEENGVLCQSVSASVSGLAGISLWFGTTVVLRLLANWVRMRALGIQETGSSSVPASEYVSFPL